MKPVGGIGGRRWGLVVGGAITVASCIAFAAGLFDRLDNYALDLHFRHLSTIEADPRIVLVDINDHALRTVGDWPWPRRRYAQLVETLRELGADAIVLDLVLAEPAPPRQQHAGLGPHYDIDTALPERGDRSEDPVIFDDDELHDAMAEAGNVYLATFFRLSPPALDRQALLDHALDLVRNEPGITLGEFDRELHAAFPFLSGTLTVDELYHRVRIAAVLEDDFGIDASGLTERLDAAAAVARRTVETHLAAAKRLVAQRAAKRFFDAHPGGNLEGFFEFVLPEVAHDVLSADRDTLIVAYRQQDALRAMATSSAAVLPTLAEHVAQAYDLTLPVDKFVKAAMGVGFVSFEREETGGVVREIPLAADVSGVLVPQLGLLVAMDTLGLDRSSIQYDKGHLVLGRGADARRLEIDEDGRTLLNWHAPRRSGRWQDSFDHIPVTRVLEIALNAEAVAENERRFGLATAELVARRHAETQAVYANYVRLINRRLALRERLADTRNPQEITRMHDELADLDAGIKRIEDEAVVWLQRVHSLWEDEEPRTEEERVQRESIRELYARFGEGQLPAKSKASNSRLAERSDALRVELRPRIEGHICLVGYTASGVADLVTSPVFGSMPGVMAHANVLNMVLQDRPAVRAPAWVNVVILLFGGIAITLITCGRGPALSLVSLLVLAFVILGVGGLVFHAFTYHVGALATAVQMSVVWGCVTAYRQFTEERARRHIQRALAQYTSPAVAARIAVSANVLDLAPQPAQVTCFFSDLYGFTRLSERLGAERTRLVLNPYLRTMSQVLVEHGAIINKFMGDGIFAFFNAPIRPSERHQEAACACALASLAALNDLNRQGAGGCDDEPLAMRIGLSTGEVFVGDYGSDTKLDYTCIGDTVNVGARLEEANKMFGTSVLVDNATRLVAEHRFAFRTLGRIEVPGRTHAVEVHELIGPSGRIDEAAQEYLGRFEQAVRHYQACQWDLCTASLDACQRARPDDRAVQRYQQAATRYRNAPPPADWNKVIALPTE